MEMCCCRWRTPELIIHATRRVKLVKIHAAHFDNSRFPSLRSCKSYQLKKCNKLLLLDWRQSVSVMQREAVTVMPSCSGGG
jgi:hypothetical protein